LDGPLQKLCPVIPTSNQDGRQAQNRKRGDEILIVHCCFSVSQKERKSLCLYSSNLGTFWLKIGQFWPFEEISSNSGHLEWRAGLSQGVV
jgi:hypothetical protein